MPGSSAEGKAWEKKGYKLAGNSYVKKDKRALPLMEAKMTRDYDHRASCVTMNAKNAYMNYDAEPVSLVDHQNPEFLPMGRYWVAEDDIVARAPESLAVAAIGFHDIARANDTRTMVACARSVRGVLQYFAADRERRGPIAGAAFAVLRRISTAYPYDFLVRQKGEQRTPQLLHRRAASHAAAGHLRRQVPVVEERNPGTLDQRAGLETHLHGRGHASAGRRLRLQGLAGRRRAHLEGGRAGRNPRRTRRRLFPPLRHRAATTPSTSSRPSPTPASCPKTSAAPSNSFSLPAARAKWCSTRWIAWAYEGRLTSRRDSAMLLLVNARTFSTAFFGHVSPAFEAPQQ